MNWTEFGYYIVGPDGEKLGTRDGTYFISEKHVKTKLNGLRGKYGCPIPGKGCWKSLANLGYTYKKFEILYVEVT